MWVHPLVIQCVVLLAAAVTAAGVWRLRPPEGFAAVPPGPAAPPTVYLGSAWARALTDLTTKPATWPTARASAGYFLQPMGFRAMGGLQPGGGAMRRLLPHFASKHFVVVESLGSATKGMDVMRNIRAALAIDPAFRCAGLALYVATDWVMKGYAEAVATFKRWGAPAKALGIPLVFFFTPVTGREDGKAWRDYLARKKAGKPLWIHFCEAAGADAVAIDFPSEHWLGNANTEEHGFKDLAVDICKTTQASRRPFIWALNGTTQSLDNVRRFARELEARGVRPDEWWVDHFNPMDQEGRGTPETAPTPSGIAAVLIKEFPVRRR